MNSHYSELKDLPQLRGSLNTIVSVKTNHGMRRPPSLSESYAWDPDNIERLQYVQQKESAAEGIVHLPDQTFKPQNELLILYQPTTTTTHAAKATNAETRILNFLLRLLFHISLISIFESLFFFFYVSTLEDTGILNVIGGFIQSATNSCMNLTTPDKSFINALLTYFVNASQVDVQGSEALVARNKSNKMLMNLSWYYVGGCCGLFIAATSYAKCRNIKIYWRKLIGENAAMILLLAGYEYVFFTTIIKPYTPITGDEIEQRAVHQLNVSCALF